ncbi:MFS transporter [Blastomyces gilchristii SLH14081]|uniref:MFS transporter n=1 Tax=Blastomyces gilchristii (strain SLH14081) TaxID=559298 RepID=A0A179UVA7_BLAGS|nr:MFS transporter [Blastomyces gilchristii SLH14081]OAT11760.1 MFS transporter [Blastomyces gilchristii SLH14081]
MPAKEFSAFHTADGAAMQVVKESGASIGASNPHIPHFMGKNMALSQQRLRHPHFFPTSFEVVNKSATAAEIRDFCRQLKSPRSPGDLRNLDAHTNELPTNMTYVSNQHAVDTYLEEGSISDRTLVWKQDLRIVPLSAAIYLLCYLDSSNTNIGESLPSDNWNNYMKNMLRLTLPLGNAKDCPDDFPHAYALFEVPSNYFFKTLNLVPRFGCVEMDYFNNYATVTVLRLLLGIFEAGLFPSLCFISLSAFATLVGAFGSAIAFAVGHMNGTRGLSGWRWLFILEGIPSCASAILVYFFLPDYPETSLLALTGREGACEGEAKSGGL